MLISLRVGVALLLLVFSGIVPGVGVQNAWSEDTFVKDLFLSLARPTEIREPEMLGDPSNLAGSGKGNVPSRSVDLKIPFREDFVTSDRPIGEFSVSDPLYPGESLARIQKDLGRIASLRSGITAASRDGLSLLDHEKGLSTSGRLVGDPRSIYSGFEIQVDKANYTVKLFGLKDNGAKGLLFECRAGLGSTEFPTPRGSFYIMRIFDDKPLWIPPEDREWALGQVPSRSVYGGHMLPFFVKRQVSSSSSSFGDTADLDCIAPQVKMVDGGMYRIHGTDSPWSVGSSQSHGCVRLLNSSVARLANTLKMYVGTNGRGETPNGPYASLARPVRLILH